MNCSVGFLKTGIVESSSKCLVQFYFHYSELCHNWIQKPGYFLLLNSIYELKNFLQNPPKKEKARFLFRFSTDFRKWIKLENLDMCFAFHHRTHIPTPSKSTDHLPRPFLAQFHTFGHILISCCTLGLITEQQQGNPHVMGSTTKRNKYSKNNEISSVPLAGQMVL